MNLDIQTEHVRMLPEWHRMIDEWVERCTSRYPDVLGIDLTLRHGRSLDEVDAVATANGRSMRAEGQAEVMAEALHDALDDLERELSVHERPVTPRP